jgi:hypothetical protein
MSRTICLDFDGVLHSYTSGWKGVDNIPDPPTPGAKEWLEKSTKIEGLTIAVFSSRSKSGAGRVAIRNWCAKHFGQGIALRLEFPEEKPPAMCYVDDRAVLFTGNWGDLDPHELMGFSPWNKK